MDSIGNKTNAYLRRSNGRRDWSRRTVMQTRHRVKGMGNHPHPLAVGTLRLFASSGAMAEAHQYSLLPQSINQQLSSWQFWRQGYERNTAFKTSNPFR
jgi:hypothetical protein